MSKEKDFNSLIEKQDEETKKNIFEKLQIKLSERDEDKLQSNQNVLIKKIFWRKKNFIIISGIFLLVLTGILLFIFLRKNTDIDDFRYCTSSDYYIEDSELNIEKYVEENKLDVLYFDADKGFEILLSQQYKLNSTNEVICLYEEIFDSACFVRFFVTDNLTEIEQLNVFSLSCKNITTIKSVNIFYGTDYENVYAKFEYNDSVYYIQVSENTDAEHLLNLVAELLN